MLFSCGIIFDGSRRDAATARRYTKLRCFPANCVAMRRGASFLHCIPLPPFQQITTFLPKNALPIATPAAARRRVEKPRASDRKSIVEQNCNFAFCQPYLPRLRQIGLRCPGSSLCRRRHRRRRNYNISADTCARLTAQLPASECFSDGRRGEARGRPIPIDPVVVAARWWLKFPRRSPVLMRAEFRVLCRRNYTVPACSPFPAHTPGNTQNSMSTTVDFARSIDETRA